MAKRIVNRPPGVTWGDAVNDTVVILLQQVKEWDAERWPECPFIAWIYMRTLSKLCDKYRKEWRAVQRLGIVTLGPAFFDRVVGPTPAEVEPGLDVRALQAAFETLPDKQREVLTALFYDANSQEDVAAARGISQPAVSKLATRGINRLRRELLGDGVEPERAPTGRTNRAAHRMAQGAKLSKDVSR